MKIRKKKLQKIYANRFSVSSERVQGEDRRKSGE